MTFWERSAVTKRDDGADGSSHELMVHKMQPCPSHSYSRAPQHGPRLGQEHQILSGDCPSVCAWWVIVEIGVMCVGEEIRQHRTITRPKSFPRGADGREGTNLRWTTSSRGKACVQSSRLQKSMAMAMMIFGRNYEQNVIGYGALDIPTKARAGRGGDDGQAKKSLYSCDIMLRYWIFVILFCTRATELRSD